jgi:toxin CptA
MHGAPAVSYPVGRCRLAAGLLAGAWLAGAAACAAWAWQVPAPAWQMAVAAGMLLATGAWGVGAILAMPQGALSWTGAAWRWQAAGEEPQSGTVTRAMDLQRWMLVHWRTPAGRSAWLWLEQRSSPHAWSALRRAVYSRARPEAPGAAQPPMAKP